MRTAVAKQAINAAAALLCGWKWYIHPELKKRREGWAMFLSPDSNLDGLVQAGDMDLTDFQKGGMSLIPDFTNPDCPHSLTRQLLQSVGTSFSTKRAISNIAIGGEHNESCIIWDVMTLAPVQIVEACLRTAGAWTPEMEAIEDAHE